MSDYDDGFLSGRAAETRRARRPRRAPACAAFALALALAGCDLNKAADTVSANVNDGGSGSGVLTITNKLAVSTDSTIFFVKVNETEWWETPSFSAGEERSFKVSVPASKVVERIAVRWGDASKFTESYVTEFEFNSNNRIRLKLEDDKLQKD